MVSEVIDLVSSSPSPNPHPADKGLTQSMNLPSTNGNGAVKSTEVYFLSDDFDTTIDLDEPILSDTIGNKRRRLSPPENNASRPAKRSLSGPIAESRESVPRNGGGRTSTIEPIEFSSSPELSIIEPTNLARNKGDVSRRASRKTTTVETFDNDTDPFAISSQPETQHVEKPPPSAQVVPESSDPFASSPLSIIETVPKPQTRTKTIVSPTVNRRPSPKRKNWDPISSSAPEACSFDSPPPRSSKQGVVINIGDSDSEDGSEEDFPDVADFDIAKCKVRSFRRTLSETAAKSRSKTSKALLKSIEEREREKEAKAASKEVEKEKKRREREEAKQAKLREKERNAALAEVNKLRTDKKVSTPEMMVDIPSSLNITTKTQLEAILEPLDVQFTTWESPVENVVKWRRKVRSRFNEDVGIWEPIPLRIQEEKHALVIMSATDFVTLAVEDELEAHITRMQENFANHHIIYLLEGLVPWQRKNRNIRNRQFTSGVRAQETQSNRRRNTVTEGYVPEETIEDALLQLQLMHDVLIHHTITPLETANWVAVFTQHVSTIPYRKQRDQATLVAGFCMESGQVRTGDDTRDTYVRMLQEIVRVTAPIAYGIASKFDTVTDLVNGLESGGPTVLEGVKKSANKDGAFSDRTVGQAVSRRMHKVFTGKDELSTDV